MTTLVFVRTNHFNWKARATYEGEGSGDDRAESKNLRLFFFAVFNPESTLMPFSVGGVLVSRTPLDGFTGASLGFFSNKLVLLLSFTKF